MKVPEGLHFDTAKENACLAAVRQVRDTVLNARHVLE
jgi:hypothetical protein